MTASRFEVALDCVAEGCDGYEVMRAPAAVRFAGIPRAFVQLEYRGGCSECGEVTHIRVIGSNAEDEREQLLDIAEEHGARWIPEATCREKQRGRPPQSALSMIRPSLPPAPSTRAAP